MAHFVIVEITEFLDNQTKKQYKTRIQVSESELQDLDAIEEKFSIKNPNTWGALYQDAVIVNYFQTP